MAVPSSYLFDVSTRLLVVYGARFLSSKLYESCTGFVPISNFHFPFLPRFLVVQRHFLMSPRCTNKDRPGDVYFVISHLLEQHFKDKFISKKYFWALIRYRQENVGRPLEMQCVHLKVPEFYFFVCTGKVLVVSSCCVLKT